MLYREKDNQQTSTFGWQRRMYGWIEKKYEAYILALLNRRNRRITSDQRSTVNYVYGTM